MKKKKNSWLTIGAFIVVAILIAGTILGIIFGNKKSSSDPESATTPIPIITETASGSSDAVSTDDNHLSARKKANKKDTSSSTDNNSKSTKTPTKSKRGKTTVAKKPAKTTAPKNDHSNKSLAEQKATGQDNEISFSDFQ